MTPKTPPPPHAPSDPASAADEQPKDERPAGFVEDAPAAIDGDESEWAAEHAKRADTDNPALAEARKRLRALVRGEPESKA